MKKNLFTAALCIGLLSGCRRYSPITEIPMTQEQEIPTASESREPESQAEEAAESEGILRIYEEGTKEELRRAVKVKGIYVSGYAAGNKEMMDRILAEVDQTEINAVVIDVKNDEGRVTFAMDSPVVTEIGASKKYIPDIGLLMEELKAREIYVIGRVVAFKDPYLAEKKPDWSLRTASGDIYRDKDGLAWVNPYRQEVWDYLVEIGTRAGEYGFDEIQFDYIRFATDKTMNQVVYDEAEVQGRSKTDIITEFTAYAYEKLALQGLFVSADVFGAIIGSEEDADSVGQIYGDMADSLDYICPMIYPSHYGDGNFGIPHPDLQPYDTIAAALAGSREDLEVSGVPGKTKAVVRPWLQDFTASYLKDHIKYGPEQVRAQIQAVYDAGYEEWILWNSSCRYSWDGLLPAEAREEQN